MENTHSSWGMPEQIAGFMALGTQQTMGVLLRAFQQGKLKLLLTVDDYEPFEKGAGVWAHASLSRPDRDPTWREIKMVRDLVFGPESIVVQVLAPEAKWINMHPHCFHLWMRLDAQTLPSALFDQFGSGA